MARLSDHDLRDAEDAGKSEIALPLKRYSRRMIEQMKTYTKDAIMQAIREDKEIDGTAIGKAAAARVIAEFFTPRKPQQAIDAGNTTAIDSAEDSHRDDRPEWPGA